MKISIIAQSFELWCPHLLGEESNTNEVTEMKRSDPYKVSKHSRLLTIAKGLTSLSLENIPSPVEKGSQQEGERHKGVKGDMIKVHSGYVCSKNGQLNVCLEPLEKL